MKPKILAMALLSLTVAGCASGGGTPSGQGGSGGSGSGGQSGGTSGGSGGGNDHQEQVQRDGVLVRRAERR